MNLVFIVVCDVLIVVFSLLVMFLRSLKLLLFCILWLFEIIIFVVVNLGCLDLVSFVDMKLDLLLFFIMFIVVIFVLLFVVVVLNDVVCIVMIFFVLDDCMVVIVLFV